MSGEGAGGAVDATRASGSELILRWDPGRERTWGWAASDPAGLGVLGRVKESCSGKGRSGNREVCVSRGVGAVKALRDPLSQGPTRLLSVYPPAPLQSLARSFPLCPRHPSGRGVGGGGFPASSHHQHHPYHHPCKTKVSSSSPRRWTFQL